MSTNNILEKDYFNDEEISLNPYDYFEQARAHGPITRLTYDDVLLITGHDECMNVLFNDDDFSSYNSSVGAGFKLPFEPVGSDISDLMEEHRAAMPHGNLLVNYDGDRHSQLRTLISPLFTPTRLKANQEYCEQLAAEMMTAIATAGKCEVMYDLATPFVTMVVADLLGVPSEDRAKFREVIDSSPRPGSINEDSNTEEFVGPLEFMARYFAGYIMERRAQPKDDVLTILANSTFPDGSLPDLSDLVTLAATIFGAGQDTSAKLLGTAIRFLATNPDLQATLRADKTKIPAFIEEVLRLEGSTKATFRLARRDTDIDGFEVPAGQRIIVALAAANRDPRRWENPDQLILDRPRGRDHLSFGRGPHLCAGAPLARVEMRIMLEQLLAHTSNIAVSAEDHGHVPAFDYEPSYFIRGLRSLNIVMTAS